MDQESGSLLIKEGETADDILNGRFKVIQKKRGYRFFYRRPAPRALRSTGKGSSYPRPGDGKRRDSPAPRPSPARQPYRRYRHSKDMADMARRTLALNRLDDHIEIREGDIRRIEDHVSSRSFDIACANPPYRRLISGRINPEGEKARARHEISGSLADFLQAASYALNRAGGLT